MRETVGPDMVSRLQVELVLMQMLLPLWKQVRLVSGTSAGVAILKENWQMATTELIELAIETSKQAYVPILIFQSELFSSERW